MNSSKLIRSSSSSFLTTLSNFNNNNFKINPFNIYGSKDGSFNLEWIHRPTRTLLIEKIYDKDSRCYLIEVSKFLHEKKNLNIFVEEYVYKDLLEISFLNQFYSYEETPIDFILAFGGDGTLLHVSSLFPEICPPILAFAMGSLGFLSPFLVNNYEIAIDDLIKGLFFLNSRTRLIINIIRDNQKVENYQCLNDFTIRTSTPNNTCKINSFIDDEYFTSIYGDGLIVATSTGSTAYNLSAGGIMIHPSVSTILWTPICAHSLNSHPIVLPDCINLSFKIDQNDRNNEPYLVSFDSKKSQIYLGDEVRIHISSYPLPTVCTNSPVTDWLFSLSTVLKWNQPIKSIINENIDEPM